MGLLNLLGKAMSGVTEEVEELVDTIYLDWQQKVYNEKEELEIKTNNLEKFISTQQFRALKLSDKTDLRSQFKYMTGYLKVLQRRITKY